MKTKRLLLAGLLSSLLAVVAVLIWAGRRPEPTYRGTPLSAWFKAYAGTPVQTLAPPAAARPFFTTNPPTWITAANRGRFIVFSNQMGWVIITNQVYSPAPPTKPSADDPWLAIQAIGSNAAPFLAAQMRHGRWEKFYERNFTNLPTFLQKELSHPEERWLRRMRAIDLANRLGYAANATAPALLQLLYETDPRTLGPVMSALRSVRAERVDVAELILRLGVENRFREVFCVAGEMGWKDREVAKLLGKILTGPDPTLHYEAIHLLESAGVRARPAADAIIASLGHKDSEIRYLSARALEQIARDIPPEERPALEAQLRIAATDSSIIVSNVARRVLARLEGQEVPSPYAP